MIAIPVNDSEKVHLTVELEVGGGRLELKMAVPSGPTRPVEMLPLLHGVADSLVGVAETNAQKSGLKVTCRKGCGACCRQLVPISEIEARQLRDMVDALPEPRRSEILARFAAARERLRDTGLVEIMLAPENADRETTDRLIRAYFKLGIACPFLEEESCSIHRERPAACREYLVVSPVEQCIEFNSEGIKRLNIPLRISRGLRSFNADGGTLVNRWVPLILALEWANDHPDVSPPRPGVELLRDAFGRLTGREVVDA